jgi:hypothetical protein
VLHPGSVPATASPVPPSGFLFHVEANHGILPWIPILPLPGPRNDRAGHGDDPRPVDAILQRLSYHFLRDMFAAAFPPRTEQVPASPDRATPSLLSVMLLRFTLGSAAANVRIQLDIDRTEPARAGSSCWTSCRVQVERNGPMEASTLSYTFKRAWMWRLAHRLHPSSGCPYPGY